MRGRLTLIKSAPSHKIIYQTSLLPAWVIKAVDEIRKHFLWYKKLNKNQQGAHLAAWLNCIRPSRLGGLGVIDLQRHNQAL